MLTFEQFQATRTWCDDLGAHFDDASLEGLPGFVYVGSEKGCGLCIEASGGGAAAALYHLQLCQDEWLETDLEALERKLYQYGCDEGHCE